MVYGQGGAVPLAATGAAAKRLADSAPWLKANFNPDQPRVPAGNPAGGQWTSEGGSPARPSADAEAGPDTPVQLAQSQTCREFIAKNCQAGILRVFPGQFLDVPLNEMLDAAKKGDPAARRAKKLLSRDRFRKWRSHREEGRMASVIFEVCRILDTARLHYFIERERGTDSILLTVTVPGERVEIDVFEDDHIEISRFRGDESIEGGMELLRELVKRETEAN